MTFKVLISDKMSTKAADVFKARGIDVDVKTGLSEAELIAIIDQYDALAIRSATTANKAVIEAAKNLKVIGRAGIGTDNIDKLAASANSIVVMNTPFGNTITTAEHTIAMMFALARHIPQANASTHQGLWEKSKFMGVELTAKTLGVIGCGNIGSIVIKKAQGLGLRVVAFDPFLSQEKAIELGIEKVDFTELLAVSDVITLHTPLTAKTKGIIDYQAMQAMKNSALIINCARGGLVVEADLLKALDEGEVAGAALDVFAVEPAKENVLFGHSKVILTPHLGASTAEAQENVAVQIAEQIADYLLNNVATNALNTEALSHGELQKISPYQKLAKPLASLAGQISQTPIQEIKIEYNAKLKDLPIKALTREVVTHTLRPMLESINTLNAFIVAEDRGIKISEVFSTNTRESTKFDIQITVVTERRSRTIAGIVLADIDDVRLTYVEGVNFEAQFSSHMLFIRNDDKPGFVGEIGTLLGKHNINVENFVLGKNTQEAGKALAIINVDQDVTHLTNAIEAGIDLVQQVVALQL